MNQQTDIFSPVLDCFNNSFSKNQKGNKLLVLDCLKDWWNKAQSGPTSRELYQHYSNIFKEHKINKYEVSRRLSDLFKACLVSQGDRRRCRVTDDSLLTWEIR